LELPRWRAPAATVRPWSWPPPRYVSTRDRPSPRGRWLPPVRRPRNTPLRKRARRGRPPAPRRPRPGSRQDGRPAHGAGPTDRSGTVPATPAWRSSSLWSWFAVYPATGAAPRFRPGAARPSFSPPRGDPNPSAPDLVRWVQATRTRAARPRPTP